jgi:hypothetical protein
MNEKTDRLFVTSYTTCFHATCCCLTIRCYGNPKLANFKVFIHRYETLCIYEYGDSIYIYIYIYIYIHTHTERERLREKEACL